MKVEQIIHFICHRDRAPSKRAAQKFFMSPHKFCVVVPCREEPCYVLHFSFLPSFFFGGNFLPSSSGCVRRISFSLYPHPAPSLSHQLNARRTRIHTHNGPLGLGSCMETYNKKNKLWSTPTQSETCEWRCQCAALLPSYRDEAQCRCLSGKSWSIQMERSHPANENENLFEEEKRWRWIGFEWFSSKKALFVE